ncbi:MAG: MurR/RpiR family transcriptional regulator [Roseibium sp.]|nr:MurR/RpiR family transcriptional regulator [Roseibium sp.]
MKPLVDIVTLLQQKLVAGTAAEQRLADVILQDVEAASRLSIADLAERASVSEPTVTRLATSMGLEGTRDLKLSLAQAIAIGGSYVSGDDDVEDGDTGQDSLGLISRYAIQAIRDVSKSLTPDVLEEISDALAKAKMVQIFGTGGVSSMAAQQMEFRLFRLGLNVRVPLDGRLQRMNAALASADAVFIGFSLSGAASSVIDSLNIGRQYGARTFAITPPSTPLARCADTVIPYRYVEDGHIYKPNSASFALMAIMDAIAFRTAEIMGPQVIENLRRIKQTLTIAETYDATLPLGD